jgi:uncharacterized protein YkwD
MSKRLPTIETTAISCPDCGTRTPPGYHDGKDCNGLVVKVDGSLRCSECGVGVTRSQNCPQCGSSLESGTSPALVSLRGQVAVTDIEDSLARRLRQSNIGPLDDDATLSAIARAHAHNTVEAEYFGTVTEHSSLSDILDQQSLAIGAYQAFQFEGYPTGGTPDAVAEQLYNEFLADFPDQQTEFTHVAAGVCWNPRGGVHGSIIVAQLVAKLPGDISPSRLEQAIHTATNERRGEHGYSKLSYDPHLAVIAGQHSRSMASENFFAHKSPDGAEMSERYREYNYAGQQAGENIAKEYAVVTDDAHSIANKIVDGWMDSLGHRENILTGEFVKEGIGVFQQSDGALLVTQNFS